MSDEPRPLDLLRHELRPDFEVKREVGRGSMAAVYQAWEPALRRSVAIKVLHPGRTQDDTARRRFEREAIALAQLDHANVADVHRFGRLSDGAPYLVMTLVTGRTLEDRLEAEGPFPPDQAIPILTAIASALAEAHQRNIVHRDVRPANVLLDEKKHEALLIDFGVASILSTTGDELTRLTNSGEKIRIGWYVSPEQLLDEDVTAFSDVYSFGILGHELLTGEGPYDVKSNRELIRAHLKGEPRSLEGAVEGLDPDIAQVLDACLRRKPTHRPAMSEVVRALKGEWKIGGRVGVRRGGLLGFLSNLIERPPKFVAAGSVVAGTLIGGVATLRQEWVFLPAWAFTLALATGGALVLTSLVIEAFHHAKGRQDAPLVERVMLGGIFAAWLVAAVAIVALGG